MRKRRETVLSPFREERSAIYHCVSRVVDRAFKFGDEERDVFVLMMRKYEKFCGVKVLSYCGVQLKVVGRRKKVHFLLVHLNT